jgi:hypothetical protein
MGSAILLELRRLLEVVSCLRHVCAHPSVSTSKESSQFQQPKDAAASFFAFT